VQFFDLYFLWKRPDARRPTLSLQTGSQKMHVVINTPPQLSGWLTMPNDRLGIKTTFKGVKCIVMAKSMTAAKTKEGRSASPHEMRVMGACTPSSDKERYEENKTYSTLQVLRFIRFSLLRRSNEQISSWKTFFEHSDKKDDLSDAVLHALFFLHTGSTMATSSTNKKSLVVIDIPTGPSSSSPPPLPVLASTTSTPVPLLLPPQTPLKGNDNDDDVWLPPIPTSKPRARNWDDAIDINLLDSDDSDDEKE
jgi:hypothetical protein